MSDIKKINKRMEITPNKERLGGALPAEFMDEVITLGQLRGYGGVSPYKKLVVLLTQSGLNDPTAVVLENTLGGTITWGRSGPGTYTGTLTGAFVANKTAFYFNSSVGEIAAVNRSSQDVISVQTYSPLTWLGVDDVLTGNTLEIRVYQ